MHFLYLINVILETLDKKMLMEKLKLFEFWFISLKLNDFHFETNKSHEIGCYLLVYYNNKFLRQTHIEEKENELLCH